MPGTFKLDHLQPCKPLLFWNFSNFFTFILGSQFLLPQRPANSLSLDSLISIVTTITDGGGELTFASCLAVRLSLSVSQAATRSVFCAWLGLLAFSETNALCLCLSPEAEDGRRSCRFWSFPDGVFLPAIQVCYTCQRIPTTGRVVGLDKGRKGI